MKSRPSNCFLDGNWFLWSTLRGRRSFGLSACIVNRRFLSFCLMNMKPCKFRLNWIDSRWWCSNDHWTGLTAFEFLCPRGWQSCLHLQSISNGCLGRTLLSWPNFCVQSKWIDFSYFQFYGLWGSCHPMQWVWAAHHTSNQSIEWAHCEPWW